MGPDLYYTVPEVAKMLKCHPRTIRNAIKAGRIQAMQISTGKIATYRIAAKELERMEVMSYEETINNVLKEREKNNKEPRT